MLKKLIICITTLIEISLAQVGNVKTRFIDSEDRTNKVALANMNDLFENRKLNINRPGIYIQLGRWKNKGGYGDFLGFIPIDSLKMKVYYVLQDPCMAGEGSYDCRDCFIETIHWDRRSLYEKCVKSFSITKEFYALVKKFFDENRKSLNVVPTWDTDYSPKDGAMCYDNLFLYYQDGTGHRKYFNMLPSGCIDSDMRKNPIIDDYINLYETLSDLFLSNFPSCRWDGFISRDLLIKNCRKYDFDEESF